MVQWGGIRGCQHISKIRLQQTRTCPHTQSNIYPEQRVSGNHGDSKFQSVRACVFVWETEFKVETSYDYNDCGYNPIITYGMYVCTHGFIFGGYMSYLTLRSITNQAVRPLRLHGDKSFSPSCKKYWRSVCFV